MLVEVATHEVIKKRRGRPPNPPNPVLEQRSETPEPIFEELEPEEQTDSAPASVSVEPYPQIQNKIKPAAGFDYWNNKLNGEQRRNGGITVYRLWPKMQLELWNGRMVNRSCLKLNDEDGVISPDSVFKHCRIGIYLIRVNQRIVKPNGTITMFEIELRGKGDWSENEMPILDIEKLDLSHPSNEDYIRVLKSRGILKPGLEDSEGEDEMAASQVLGDIASRAMEKLGNQPQAAAPVQAATDLAGVVTPIIGLLEKQINQNRPPAEQGTVLQMVEALTAISKANAPAPMDMAPFLELQKQNNALVEKMMQKDVERAEADARKAREEADSYRQSLPKPKTVDEQFDELERAAKRYERMTGKNRDDDEEDKPEAVATAGLLGTIVGSLPILERILAHGANMLYNWKLNGSGAVPLNPGTAQPGNQPIPPQPAASAAPEETTADLSAEEQARMEHMQNVVTQLSALEKPMLKFFLDPTKTGRDFAKFTIENFGGECFATVGSVGKQGLVNMLSQYPPVWDVVGPKIQEFSKFLDEFLTYQAAAVQ